MIAEWIISSTVLTIIVIFFRLIFKGRISLRLQYALWGLVLVRLLLPFSLGSSQFSAANIPYAMKQQIAESTKMKDDRRDVDHTNTVNVHFENLIGNADHSVLTEEESNPDDQKQNVIEQVYSGTDFTDSAISITSLAAYVLWALGAIVVGGVFLYTNSKFCYEIKRSRYQFDVGKKGLMIYISPSIETPCLFGFFRPAIYLTREVAEDPKTLRHSVTHEITHYRHKDHIWSVMRCVCLVIHWYNPLVWFAAYLSQKDAELACDEATIKALGEKERAEYGRTLIEMTCEKKVNIFMAATTMTVSKGGIRERVLMIVKKPKMAVYTLLIMLLITVIAVGCTFTGGKDLAPEMPVEDSSNGSDPSVVTNSTTGETGYTEPLQSLETTKPEPANMDSFMGIKSATLEWNGTHTVTDEASLKLLETRLSNSEPLGYGASCPFTAQLTLEFDDREAMTISMATDNCAAWTSDGVYYRYSILTEDGYSDNYEFYALFSADVIHDFLKTDMERFGESLAYLDFERYEAKYGSGGVFELMDAVKKLVIHDPDGRWIWTALSLTDDHGLDGIYADYYGGILSDLFEADKGGFAWECLGNASENIEKSSLEILAMRWGISISEARSVLESEIPES